MSTKPTLLFLLCRVGTRLCALPLEYVMETMRPLPVEPLSGAPPFVSGLAIIRGAPVPVLDTASLLRAEKAVQTRFVTVHAGDRCVALAVGAVLGVRPLPEASLLALPPLLRDAGADAVAAIATLDGELLLVLSTARLLPDETVGEEGSP